MDRAKFALIFLVCFVVNGFASGYSPEQKAIQQRLAPVGKVNVADDSAEQAKAEAEAAKSQSSATTTATTTTAATKQAAKTSDKDTAAAGKKVYQAHCIACHASGVAGSPKLGDKAAWQPRADTGMSQMLNTVKKGKGAMPPMGTCMNCTDQMLRCIQLLKTYQHICLP